ncbi:MAG: DUF4352 domain-containing protein [Clostridia bacterium]|nr:DUF4352 domain-containing protein [Clostridia bacterium]
MAMKKCKECGEEISSSAKKCPKCGKDQRNFFMKHPVLYTILILMIIGIVAGSGSDNTGNTTVTSTGNQVQETVYNIGDAISNEKYEITIKNVSTATKVGSQYLNSQPAEGGVYVCVDFTYKNVSTEPISSWDFPTVELVDSNGVEYSSDVSASSYYATEKDPNRKVLSDLNPGITVTDNKVFEIAEESYNQGEWYLVVDNNTKIKVK